MLSSKKHKFIIVHPDISDFSRFFSAIGYNRWTLDTPAFVQRLFFCPAGLPCFFWLGGKSQLWLEEAKFWLVSCWVFPMTITWLTWESKLTMGKPQKRYSTSLKDTLRTAMGIHGNFLEKLPHDMMMPFLFSDAISGGYLNDQLNDQTCATSSEASSVRLPTIPKRYGATSRRQPWRIGLTHWSWTSQRVRTDPAWSTGGLVSMSF